VLLQVLFPAASILQPFFSRLQLLSVRLFEFSVACACDLGSVYVHSVQSPFSACDLNLKEKKLACFRMVLEEYIVFQLYVSAVDEQIFFLHLWVCFRSLGPNRIATSIP
jgi:hypothetical protein